MNREVQIKHDLMSRKCKFELQLYYNDTECIWVSDVLEFQNSK